MNPWYIIRNIISRDRYHAYEVFAIFYIILSFRKNPSTWLKNIEKLLYCILSCFHIFFVLRKIKKYQKVVWIEMKTLPYLHNMYIHVSNHFWKTNSNIQHEICMWVGSKFVIWPMRNYLSTQRDHCNTWYVS